MLQRLFFFLRYLPLGNEYSLQSLGASLASWGFVIDLYTYNLVNGPSNYIAYFNSYRMLTATINAITAQ